MSMGVQHVMNLEIVNSFECMHDIYMPTLGRGIMGMQVFR